jgi:hypothetical protein
MWGRPVEETTRVQKHQACGGNAMSRLFGIDMGRGAYAFCQLEVVKLVACPPLACSKAPRPATAFYNKPMVPTFSLRVQWAILQSLRV